MMSKVMMCLLKSNRSKDRLCKRGFRMSVRDAERDLEMEWMKFSLN